jgi:hypothetical protein
MDASSSPEIGLRHERIPPARYPRSDAIGRVIAFSVVAAVEAILVGGLIALALLPGAYGDPGTGPDRPAIPLSAPVRP